MKGYGGGGAEIIDWLSEMLANVVVAVLARGVLIWGRELNESAREQQWRLMMMRMEPESRVMRRFNGELLKEVANDGTIFKGDAQREMTRRSNKTEKRGMTRGGKR